MDTDFGKMAKTQLAFAVAADHAADTQLRELYQQLAVSGGAGGQAIGCECMGEGEEGGMVGCYVFSICHEWEGGWACHEGGHVGGWACHEGGHVGGWAGGWVGMSRRWACGWVGMCVGGACHDGGYVGGWVCYAWVPERLDGGVCGVCVWGGAVCVSCMCV